MNSSNEEKPTLIAEVASRLQETEARAARVIGALELQQSIQDSFETAGRGLHDANSAIADLARATTEANQALMGTVSALREAIDVLQRADPATLKASIETGLVRVARDIGHGLGEVSAKADRSEAGIRSVGQELRELGDRFRANATGSDQRIGRIEAELEDLGNRVEADLKRLGDQVVDRLRPRSLWEGVAGRRKV